MAWHSENSGGKTQPVGQKKANELGLYDMSGNVWEWCWDWDVDYLYPRKAANDPKGPNTGETRVICGYANKNKVPPFLDIDGDTVDGIQIPPTRIWLENVTFRGNQDPEKGYSFVGFRLARTVGIF